MAGSESNQYKQRSRRMNVNDMSPDQDDELHECTNRHIRRFKQQDLFPYALRQTSFFFKVNVYYNSFYHQLSCRPKQGNTSIFVNKLFSSVQYLLSMVSSVCHSIARTWAVQGQLVVPVPCAQCTHSIARADQCRLVLVLAPMRTM
jgi:predicted RNA-binding Zn-ribbon protein involved in translation (DUF1610 family)